MLRVDLLRSLPRSATATAAHSGKSARTGRPAPTSPSGSPGPLKPVLTVLLLLVVGGLTAVWFTKPEWLNLKHVSNLWAGQSAGYADSVRHADLLHRQASRQVEARQTAAVDWLTALESVLPVTQGFGTLTLTAMTFTASGAFVLEGEVTSAEALSAFQEALVLIPRMELMKSRATEDSIRGGYFSFRFEGLVSPGTTDSAGRATDSSDRAEGADESTMRVSRVIKVSALPAQLDSMVSSAARSGISFSQAGKGRTGPFGDLKAHAYRLKGVPAATATDGDSTVISNLRNLLDQERHRGSPFAFQRITLLQNQDSRTVFLDILALTP